MATIAIPMSAVIVLPAPWKMVLPRTARLLGPSGGTTATCPSGSDFSLSPGRPPLQRLAQARLQLVGRRPSGGPSKAARVAADKGRLPFAVGKLAEPDEVFMARDATERAHQIAQ